MPRGGGTVNQYSETEVGGLTLSDWDYTETSDKITLTKYKGNAVNVVIPSEFEERPGVSVEVATFDGMFDNLKKENSSGNPKYYNELVSLKVGTTDQKVTLGIDSINSVFYEANYWFTELETVDLSGLDTSNVTNMCGMFLGCENLKNIKGLETLDTSKVTNMSGMFFRCKSLEHIDVSNFDTKNVTTMSNMFQDCTSLESLDLSNFNTYKLEYMFIMFGGCTNLKSIKFSDTFDTSNIVDMGSVFQGCNRLERLDLSNFDTSKVTTMNWMFFGCSSLETLDLSNFNTEKVADMSYMFAGCTNLNHVKGLETLDTSSCKRFSGMFQNCGKFNIIDLSNWNSNENCYINGMFYYNESEIELIPLDDPIPLMIITEDKRIIDNIDPEDKWMTYYNRTPYYAKVVYHGNDGTFNNGNTESEAIVYQADHFIYSTMAEAKQDFTLTGTTILTNNPSASLSKEGFIFNGWYLDEACTMPLAETDLIDFMTLENGTLQLYAGYKEETPKEPEIPEKKPTKPEENKGESSIEEIKKEENETVHTGDEVSKGMYYVLLGGSVIVFAAMLRKNRSSEQ